MDRLCLIKSGYGILLDGIRHDRLMNYDYARGDLLSSLDELVIDQYC